MSICLRREFLARACCAALFSSCAGALPEPPRAPQPPDAFVRVPYPPPAALSEAVPPPPPGRVVWRDGCWVWRGRSYVWERGGWLIPPPGGRFATCELAYSRDGTALFAENAWYDSRGRLLNAPPILVPATTPRNEITTESQSGR
ncbi:MAG TPA: hypothetical protein VGJ84_19800 [Polyangiaceae bacterium]